MRIHFVGSEGASMKALAKIAQADGFTVSGSDRKLGGHKAEFAAGADEVVYSAAVPYDAPELVYAREHGIPLSSRAEYLGRIARNYRTTVAVAGSHGKTTVTAMLGAVFESYDPTVHLGGEECRAGGKRFFITEACEYKRSFLHLSPTVSVVLNVALDHTDYYRDLKDITSAFDVFSRSARVRIVNGDEEASEPLRSGKFMTFGLGENCDFAAADISVHRGGSEFSVLYRGRTVGRIELGVAGRHNVANALAAFAVSASMGIPFERIKNGLHSFSGVSRRLELLGNIDGSDVYTDYAHHPYEIASVLGCLRECGYRKVCVVFEPHTYSRTQSLMSDFADALARADGVILAPVFAARENPIEGVDSHALMREIKARGTNAEAVDTYGEINERAREYARKGYAVIYCGAGTIDGAARNFIKNRAKISEKSLHN